MFRKEVDWPIMDTGDGKEIEQLYLRMYPLLAAYARSQLDSDAIAEEAVQDTFVIACQKRRALADSPNPEGWLMNTLKNVISNTIRSQNSAKRILAEYIALHSQDILIHDDQISLEAQYGSLACLEEFRLLKEMAVDGKSCQQMARERNITLTACRKRVERAKNVLRKKISL